MEKIYKLGVKKKVFADLKGRDKVRATKNERAGYSSAEFLITFARIPRDRQTKLSISII